MSLEDDDYDLVTCDVTIDLDYGSDIEDQNESLVESFDETVLTEIIIDPPIHPRQARISISSDVRVCDLAQNVVNILIQQLDAPSYGSFSSWKDVLGCFQASVSDVQRIEKSVKPVEQLFTYLRNHSVHRLLDVFETIKRVDMLIILKKLALKDGILRTGKEYNTRYDYNLPQQLNTISLAEPTNSRNVILINHYEKTDLERKSFRWFMKNLRKNLENFKVNHLKPMDVAEIENNDDGNVIEKIHGIYLQAPHIIVCYNATFLDALTTTQPDPAFQYRKYIHQQTIAEFFSNQARNLRCRSVLMPGTTTAEQTGWCPFTTQYSFPEGFERLMLRLAKTEDSSLNTI